MYQLLFLEFIGTSELLVVLVVALIIFGPRKLPELGRSLGKAMHQMRSASEDFKRTWEYEARVETNRSAALAPAASDEQAAEARLELASVDTEAQAEEVVETHTPAPEAQSPNGLSYVNRDAAFGEV